MGQISSVGIKRIIYADTSVVNKDITADFAKTIIKAAITAKTEVPTYTGKHGASKKAKPL